MTLMSRIHFEEPPAKGHSTGKKTKHQVIAEKLARRPGQWAHVATYRTPSSAGSIAHLMRTAKLKAYAPAHSYEAAVRNVNGSQRIYARYVGEGGATE